MRSPKCSVSTRLHVKGTSMKRMIGALSMLLKSVKTVEFLQKHNKISVSYNQSPVQQTHHLLIDLLYYKTQSGMTL